MKQLKILLIITTVLLVPVSGVLSYTALVPVKNKNGMYQAVFKLDRKGEVQVNLPSDITLDENVSGSVIYSGGLSQFELLIEGSNIPLHGGGNFTYKLPGNVSTGVVKVTLRYSNGVEIGKAFFPVSIGKLREPSAVPDGQNFKLPYFGNSGMPLAVKGIFDGNYTNTLITLAEQRLRILAESTTSCVFVTTNSLSGEGVLKISELGKKQETKFTNLAVVKIEDRQPTGRTGFSYKNEKQTERRVVESEVPEKPDFSRIPQEELHVDIPGKTETDVPAANKRTGIERQSSFRTSSAASTDRAVRSAPSYTEIEGEIQKHFNAEFYPVNRARGNYADDNTLLSERDYAGITSKSDKKVDRKDSGIENNTGKERQLVAKSIKSPAQETSIKVKTPVTEKKVMEPEKVKGESELANKKENVNKTVLEAGDRVKNNQISSPETVSENAEQKAPEKKLDNVTAIKGTAEKDKEKSVELEKVVKKAPDQKIKPEKTSETKKGTEESETPIKITGLKVEHSEKQPDAEKIPEKENSQNTGKKEINEPTLTDKKNPAKSPEKALQDDGNILDIIRPLPDTGDNEIASIAESLKNDPGVSDSGESSKGKNYQNGYCIQLASFKKESEIEGFVAKMKKLNYKEDVKMVKIPDRGEWHRVRICEFKSRKEAETFISSVDKTKLNVSDIYVTEY